MYAIFIWFVILCYSSYVSNSHYYDNSVSNEQDILYNDYFRKSGVTEKPIQSSFFPSLESYHVGAKRATEKTYPWIARVVHSPTRNYPHICTAVCIDERIFITASRCIFSLKVNYTRVVYHKINLPVIAFVIPSEPSKQAFDDIGFIVVEGNPAQWYTIDPVEYKRTDDDFGWFEALHLSRHRVVGYVVKKFINKVKTPTTEYQLSALDVHVGRNMCAEIFTLNLIQAFHVPCYHGCSLEEFRKDNTSTHCKKYIGPEGGAIFNTITNKLLGIATWGAYFSKYELPVGFSVPNSNNFFKDYECAKKIRDDFDSSGIVARGHYQRLCDA